MSTAPVTFRKTDYPTRQAKLSWSMMQLADAQKRGNLLDLMAVSLKIYRQVLTVEGYASLEAVLDEDPPDEEEIQELTGSVIASQAGLGNAEPLDAPSTSAA